METVMPVITQHAAVTLSCTQTHKAPWFSPALKILKQEHRRAEALWRKRQGVNELEILKIKKRMYHAAIQKEKIVFLGKLLKPLIMREESFQL